MKYWPHKHILTLANFSKEDFKEVINLSNKFSSLNNLGTKKVPALQGYLVTSIFFEASTRTKNSFELAAKRLSADVQSFSPESSSLSKGETYLDTALTYSSMGSNILIIRHSSSHTPADIANTLEKQNKNTCVLSAGDGMHSHPSQGLLDLFTLVKFFSPDKLDPNILDGKTILIIGDVLHSRVARSNIWALTAFGANIILCGPETLIPESFQNFVDSPPPDQLKDPIVRRGKIFIARSLKKVIKRADAIITLRLQKERMRENLLNSIKSYSNEFCLTPEKLNLNTKNIPILHPGPINRGVEISSRIVDDYPYCLINNQVANGIPVRMAMLYLMSKYKNN
tara:strand:+ start:722 stop:1741 length:1020 start_codon:yes stop_codon:yes gene_type:complete